MAKRTAEDLVKSVRDRSFPYEKREPEKRNWSQYDDAQVNEIADILETIREVVDIAASNIPERKKTAGRPPVPDSDIVKAMLMQTYFGMPNRIAQEWLEHYSMRSISECVNSMMKRKKLLRRKKTEETLKINMYNLRQYNHLRHTNPEFIRDYREISAK